MLVVGVGTAVTSASTGGIATVNEVTARALLALPEESVTVIVQFEYVVPSFRALKVSIVSSRGCRGRTATASSIGDGSCLV